MRWVIFCWSDSSVCPPLRPDDFIVCADSGLDYARRCGVSPVLVLGDFDSVLSSLPAGCETVRLPREKDDTDTVAALRLGLRRGIREFLIVGGFGGRQDHFFGAVQTLAFALSHGAKAEMSDGKQFLTLLQGPASRSFPRQSGYLSLFSYTPVCRGVCVSGVKYPLADAELTFDYPLGVSNEFITDASVSVSEGTLAVFTVGEAQ